MDLLQENLQFKVAELLIKIDVLNQATQTIVNNVIEGVDEILDLVLQVLEVCRLKITIIFLNGVVFSNGSFLSISLACRKSSQLNVEGMGPCV